MNGILWSDTLRYRPSKHYLKLFRVIVCNPSLQNHSIESSLFQSKRALSLQRVLLIPYSYVVLITHSVHVRWTPKRIQRLVDVVGRENKHHCRKEKIRALCVTCRLHNKIITKISIGLFNIGRFILNAFFSNYITCSFFKCLWLELIGFNMFRYSL